MDLLDLRIDRFCHLVWHFMTQGAESEQDVERVRADLWRPPKGEAPHERSPWSAANEMAAFSALKSETGA